MTAPVELMIRLVKVLLLMLEFSTMPVWLINVVAAVAAAFQLASVKLLLLILTVVVILPVVVSTTTPCKITPTAPPRNAIALLFMLLVMMPVGATEKLGT